MKSRGSNECLGVVKYAIANLPQYHTLGAYRLRRNGSDQDYGEGNTYVAFFPERLYSSNTQMSRTST